MFGFGLMKLLFTVLVVAAVWYGFRYFSGKQNRVGGSGGGNDGNVGGGGSSPKVDAEDLSACPVCGTFVRPATATNCGRGDCPYSG
jgi:uncharacterized protein